MASFSTGSKVANSPVPGVDSQSTEAALPARVPLKDLLGRDQRSTTPAQTPEATVKALGLEGSPTNQQVINALHARYNNDYSAMYLGAERDFGIQVDDLVREKHQPFIKNAVRQEAHREMSSAVSMADKQAAAREKFLGENGLNGASTNRELIIKLYDRYGSNDATTYARARKDLGIDIDTLAENRGGRIDGQQNPTQETHERSTRSVKLADRKPSPSH